MDSPRSRPANIPSVDRLLHAAALEPVLAEYGRTRVLAGLRTCLESLRSAALAGSLDPGALTDQAIAQRLRSQLQAAAVSSLRPVFNLTGTVLHTNLGRAVLPEECVTAVVQALRSPVSLEYDLASGGRGDRDFVVEKLLCELTGAEAATVVNNNAAAVLLMLSALAARREVIVSRGELVEIGGSFRIPDIMRQAGVRLREVGTTNRTHLSDYAEAVGPRTGLLMKVHTSNYAVSGFTHSVSVSELAELARNRPVEGRAVPVAADLGSGSLIDMSRWNLPSEPTVQETVAGGADIVSFSGDKLLGGPQAGLLVGRAEIIGRVRKHPLKRALRVGKLTLAALEPVLALYRSPEFLAERLTTLKLLTRPVAEMQAQALRLLPIVQQSIGDAFEAKEASLSSQIGSGALPVDTLPSYGLAVRTVKGRRGSLDRLEGRLREFPRPVIGRVSDKTLWLDLRCLELEDEAAFCAQWALLAP